MKDDPISTCPECAGPVKRLLYPVGVVFKGSGWYITDSRKPEKSESSGDGDSAKSSEGDKSAPAAKETESKASKEPAAAQS